METTCRYLDNCRLSMVYRHAPRNLASDLSPALCLAPAMTQCPARRCFLSLGIETGSAAMASSL